jgi:hypothetical protein
MMISEPLAALSGTSIFVSDLFAQAVPPVTRNPPIKAADVTMKLLLFIPISFQRGYSKSLCFEQFNEPLPGP